MSKETAREKIIEEFRSKFNEWVSDMGSLSDGEIGRKYGGKPKSFDDMGEHQRVIFFQKYVFAGHCLPEWSKLGINPIDIYALNRDGFLSYDYRSDWMSKQTGRSEFYYLSKKTAMQIMREVTK